MNPLIKVENLRKSYTIDKDKDIEILRGIDLEIMPGDFCIIYGASGSGKSTLLHHIAGLELPTTGSITVNGTNITKLDSEKRAIFRCHELGMVYQIWYWVKSLTVWENVAMPALINGETESVAMKKAMERLKSVNMQDFAYKRPMQLSGGEQQRVGLARALVNDPEIIIADEPTGNLDSHNSDEMMELFQKLNVEQKRTIIMVTHNLAYLPLANRIYNVKDGLISKENPEAQNA